MKKEYKAFGGMTPKPIKQLKQEDIDNIDENAVR